MEKYTDEKIRQRIAAKAIIEHMSRILILRGALPTYAEGVNTGKHNFPGGRIEPGEPFYRGFRREIFEETGLHVTIGDPVYVDEWFPKIGNEQNQIVGVFFDCTAQTDEVRSVVSTMPTNGLIRLTIKITGL